MISWLDDFSAKRKNQTAKQKNQTAKQKNQTEKRKNQTAKQKTIYQLIIYQTKKRQNQLKTNECDFGQEKN